MCFKPTVLTGVQFRGDLTATSWLKMYHWSHTIPCWNAILISVNINLFQRWRFPKVARVFSGITERVREGAFVYYFAIQQERQESMLSNSERFLRRCASVRLTKSKKALSTGHMFPIRLPLCQMFTMYCVPARCVLRNSTACWHTQILLFWISIGYYWLITLEYVAC